MSLKNYLSTRGRGAAASLARELRVPDVYVLRWANGTQKPTGQNLANLIRATGLPPEVLRPDMADVFKATRDLPQPAPASAG